MKFLFLAKAASRSFSDRHSMYANPVNISKKQADHTAHPLRTMQHGIKHRHTKQQQNVIKHRHTKQQQNVIKHNTILFTTLQIFFSAVLQFWSNRLLSLQFCTVDAHFAHMMLFSHGRCIERERKRERENEGETDSSKTWSKAHTAVSFTRHKAACCTEMHDSHFLLAVTAIFVSIIQLLYSAPVLFCTIGCLAICCKKSWHGIIHVQQQS